MKPSGGENNAIVILTKTAYRLRKTLNIHFWKNMVIVKLKINEIYILLGENVHYRVFDIDASCATLFCK
jgi:hypothetical protein